MPDWPLIRWLIFGKPWQIRWRFRYWWRGRGRCPACGCRVNTVTSVGGTFWTEPGGGLVFACAKHADCVDKEN